MSWNYQANPQAIPRDAVRILIGDTASDDQLVSDEEIAYFLAGASNSEAAAASVADALAAKFARAVDRTVGPVTVRLSQKAEQFRKLADSLWGRAGGSSMAIALAGIYCGGIDLAEKDAARSDGVSVEPKFTRDSFKSSEGGDPHDR